MSGYRGGTSPSYFLLKILKIEFKPTLILCWTEIAWWEAIFLSAKDSCSCLFAQNKSKKGNQTKQLKNTFFANFSMFFCFASITEPFFSKWVFAAMREKVVLTSEMKHLVPGLMNWRRISERNWVCGSYFNSLPKLKMKVKLFFLKPKIQVVSTILGQ